MAFVIDSPNEFGALHEGVLERFEQEHLFIFPTDYRQFLLANNGGEPKPNVIDFRERGEQQSDIVTTFYGIHDGPEWSRLDWNLGIFRGRMPKEFVPITGDPFGNQFLIGVNPPFESRIYFWDHELESDEGTEPTLENMSFVANSFTEFLNLLRDE